MSWSGLAFRRILQLLGAFEVAKMLWGLGRKYRHLLISGPCYPNGNERLLIDLNKLNEDVVGITEEMNVLLTNRHQAEKQKDGQSYEQRRCIRELGLQFEETTNKLKEDVQESCSAIGIRLNAFIKAAEQKHEQDKFEYVAATELTRTEMQQLRETVENYGVEMKEFQVGSVRIAKERLEKMEKSLQEKHEEYSCATESACTNSYENHRGQEAVCRQEVLNETVERYKETSNALFLLEQKHIERLADFEICMFSKLANELSPLGYQRENVPERGGLDENFIILWQIPGFREKLNCLTQEQRAITSKEFFTIKNGLKVRPVLTRRLPTDSFVEIHLEFLEEQDEGAETDCSPFLHYRSFFLLDQRQYSNRDDIELIDRPLFTKGENTCMKDRHFSNPGLCRLEEFQYDNKYVRNDKVLIKIALESVAFVTRNLAAHDGVLKWKICQYSAKIRDQVMGRKRWLISPPFRTSGIGYFAQVEVMFIGDSNFDDVDKHAFISVRVRFLLGISDRQLNGPLRGICTHVLMDQSESQHRQDISSFMEFGFDDPESGEERMVGVWDMPRCFLRSKADTVPYVNNDSILLHTTLQIH